VAAVVATAGDDDVRVAPFLRLLSATGMRRGEACALQWSDVNFDAATVRVDEAVVAARGDAEVRGPKTRASIRTIAPDSGTLAQLEGLRIEQADQAAKAGLPLGADAFVFSFEAGGETPPHPDSFGHALARVRARAGLAADIHLHSLQHLIVPGQGLC
jgi:integrase